MNFKRAFAALSLSLAVLSSSAAHAHMAWLASDEKGHVIFWFGESTEDRTYHMPENVAKIKLHRFGDGQLIGCESVDRDDLIGLRSVASVSTDRNSAGTEIAGTVTYGLYHGTKLTYYVEHLAGKNPKQWPTEPRADAPMQSVIVPTSEGGVEVTVYKDGQPLADTEVKLFCEEGHEEGAEKTDSEGRVTFSRKEVEGGLNAIMVGYTDSDASGTFEGSDYKSESNYLTSTFFIKRGDEKKKGKQRVTPEVASDSGASVQDSGLKALPEELTSFGAAIAGGRLYVYGGHTGSAHSYSTAEQSNRLWSLDLASGSEWKTVSEGPRLQGLALVPVGDRVLRIGGFTAMNDEGEEHDLQSQSSVAYYSNADRTWVDVADLPEPRSSFDAAVLNEKVYVVGGWQLGGEAGEKWHDTAWSLDLNRLDEGWTKLATPPFKRRALSVAAHDGKIYAIGGMQMEGGPTTKVNVYDPATDRWSEGPALPGSGMSGFGSSAFATGGSLYVTCYDGFVHRLSDDGKHWATVAKIEPGRFFHRMLPTDDQNLVLIGGANMETGKFTDIPVVKLGKTD